MHLKINFTLRILKPKAKIKIKKITIKIMMNIK
jgi:hypothetical protein